MTTLAKSEVVENESVLFPRPFRQTAGQSMFVLPRPFGNGLDVKIDVSGRILTPVLHLLEMLFLVGL